MLYVFLFAFSASAHFHLGGRSHFSFSHRRYKILMFFFQRHSSPLFVSLTLALSLLSTLKFSWKEDSALTAVNSSSYAWRK